MPFDRTIAYLRHVGLTVDARLIVLSIREGAMSRELRQLAEALRSQPGVAMKSVNAEIAALGKDLADIPAGAVAKVKAYRKELRAAAAEVDAALAQLTNGGETESPLSGSQASSAPAPVPSLGTAQASPGGAAAAGHETTAAAGNPERASEDAPPPKPSLEELVAARREAVIAAAPRLTDDTPPPPPPPPRPAHEVVARVVPPGGHP